MIESPRVSVAVPVFNEEEVIPLLLRRTTAVRRCESVQYQCARNKGLQLDFERMLIADVGKTRRLLAASLSSAGEPREW